MNKTKAVYFWCAAFFCLENKEQGTFRCPAFLMGNRLCLNLDPVHDAGIRRQLYLELCAIGCTLTAHILVIFL